MGKAKAYRILVVDDDPSVHRSFQAIVETLRGCAVCGSAFDGLEAAKKARAEGPDLILMDITMPGCSGIEATREIRRFDLQVRILFHSGHPELAEAGLAAGGNGFIAKPAAARAVQTALDAMRENGAYFDGQIWETLRRRLVVPQLTVGLFSEDEQRIARLLLEGYTTKEIAGRLDLTSKRVEKLRARMMITLQARNATMLVLKLAAHFPEAFPIV